MFHCSAAVIPCRRSSVKFRPGGFANSVFTPARPQIIVVEKRNAFIDKKSRWVLFLFWVSGETKRQRI